MHNVAENFIFSDEEREANACDVCGSISATCVLQMFSDARHVTSNYPMWK